MTTPSEVFRAWAAANVAADMGAWSPLVADDFTYVHSRSNIETKPELLAAFEGGRRYARWEIEDLAERQYSGCAVLNGVAHLTAGTSEQPVNLDVRLTATLVANGESWQLAAVQTTRLPD
ncbi:MAG: nuclear transport factor 2 family protein [Chloroflexi bacterium]|nr:nuclear transport factor 2 family protein [Chloroflexota bacterium]MDA1146731.1 nuclear transport factor 2 family protein [Chloroflexota bacterium]